MGAPNSISHPNKLNSVINKINTLGGAVIRRNDWVVEYRINSSTETTMLIHNNIIKISGYEKLIAMNEFMLFQFRDAKGKIKHIMYSRYCDKNILGLVKAIKPIPDEKSNMKGIAAFSNLSSGHLYVANSKGKRKKVAESSAYRDVRLKTDYSFSDEEEYKLYSIDNLYILDELEYDTDAIFCEYRFNYNLDDLDMA